MDASIRRRKTALQGSGRHAPHAGSRRCFWGCPTRCLERGIFVRRTKTGEIRYGISYMAHGRRIREMVRLSKTLAKSALAKRHVEIAKDWFEFPSRRKALSVAEFCGTYLQHAQQNKRSWRRDAGVITKIQEFFSTGRLDRVTAWDIERYKSKRVRSVTKAGVNRELAIIKRMFKLAVEWGFLESNPTTTAKLFKEDERPIRVLSGEEENWLLEAASPHLRPIVVVALNTGMRRGEILGLTRENVSFSKGVITVEQSKSGRIRHISMNQDVVDALQGVEGPRSGAVFKWKGDAI